MGDSGIACVRKFGILDSGHYTAVSREGSTMVEYDDLRVRMLPPGAVTSGDVYVLWYAREI